MTKSDDLFRAICMDYGDPDLLSSIRARQIFKNQGVDGLLVYLIEIKNPKILQENSDHIQKILEGRLTVADQLESKRNMALYQASLFVKRRGCKEGD